LGIALAGALAGCGTPGAPQPPSLNLPDRVTDLAATRAGGQVSLTWTMPKKNTDKLLLQANVEARICRQDEAGACETVGAGVAAAPGAAGAFTETLPPALASGAPRGVTYFVELRNSGGHSAGLSNAATVLAGQAPGPIEDLRAEVRKDGVALRWSPGGADSVVRLHRLLLTPPARKPAAERAPLLAAPEPLEQALLVESAGQPGGALDKTIQFGETYEYRAQRVVRVTSGGRPLELAGELSAPVRVVAADVFPPAVPTGLAAVATAAGPGTESAIDLSWQPNTEPDLAGYAVYRREAGGNWERISPEQPGIGPAFHDAHVRPGHTYIYVVSAIDEGGHESAHSSEAQETVPNP
jgi:hypothetical protein